MAQLDTHAVIEELIASGTPKKEAEVFVKNFVIKEELSSIEKEQSQLATKMDIVKLESKVESVESRLESGLNKLESKIDGVESRLESKIDKLESKLDSGFNSINTNLKWISFLVIAVLTPILGLLIKDLFF